MSPSKKGPSKQTSGTKDSSKRTTGPNRIKGSYPPIELPNPKKPPTPKAPPKPNPKPKEDKYQLVEEGEPLENPLNPIERKPSYKGIQDILNKVNRATAHIKAESARLTSARKVVAIKAMQSRTHAIGRPSLSPREEEISLLVGEGMGIREVAGELRISESTVRRSLLHAVEKLGFLNRDELFHYIISVTRAAERANLAVKRKEKIGGLMA